MNGCTEFSAVGSYLDSSAILCTVRHWVCWFHFCSARPVSYEPTLCGFPLNSLSIFKYGKAGGVTIHPGSKGVLHARLTQVKLDPIPIAKYRAKSSREAT